MVTGAADAAATAEDICWAHAGTVAQTGIVAPVLVLVFDVVRPACDSFLRLPTGGATGCCADLLRGGLPVLLLLEDACSSVVDEVVGVATVAGEAEEDDEEPSPDDSDE